MGVVGIVCEYNPFHLGHARQIAEIRRQDPEALILCAMSGDYVQRGEPAVFSRRVRAEAAVRCGADLVVELPVNVSLSSAEGFASGAAELLAALGAQKLCFGAESGTGEDFLNAARLLEDPALSGALRPYLDQGLPFAAARARAFRDLGGDPGLLEKPNNILGVEYCRAIVRKNLPLTPMVITRRGDYHAETPDPTEPSATALRAMLSRGEDISPYVPEMAKAVFDKASVHSLQAGERAILARLRAMGDEEFEALPFGGEGLWRKLMKESRSRGSLEEIIAGVKSKRYPRTRINRMILCAFLGLTAADLASPAPYARILAIGEGGRQLLRQERQIPLLHLGEKSRDPWAETERRAKALYGLFAEKQEPPAPEEAVVLLRTL